MDKDSQYGAMREHLRHLIPKLTSAGREVDDSAELATLEKKCTRLITLLKKYNAQAFSGLIAKLKLIVTKLQQQEQELSREKEQQQNEHYYREQRKKNEVALAAITKMLLKQAKENLYSFFRQEHAVTKLINQLEQNKDGLQNDLTNAIAEFTKQEQQLLTSKTQLNTIESQLATKEEQLRPERETLATMLHQEWDRYEHEAPSAIPPPNFSQILYASQYDSANISGDKVGFITTLKLKLHQYLEEQQRNPVAPPTAGEKSTAESHLNRTTLLARKMQQHIELTHSFAALSEVALLKQMQHKLKQKITQLEQQEAKLNHLIDSLGKKVNGVTQEIASLSEVTSPTPLDTTITPTPLPRKPSPFAST